MKPGVFFHMILLRGAKRIAALTLLSASLCGCDSLRAGLDLESVEERLREAPTRPGKVGVLRALETVHSANALARGLANRPQSRCELVIDAHLPFVYSLQMRVQRSVVQGEPAHWDETRRLRRDAEGNLELIVTADFQTENGLSSRRQTLWRIIDDVLFVAELPGPFERRVADAQARAMLWSEGLGVVQVLLDSVASGWQSEGGDGLWNAGGERLRCESTASTTHEGFLKRFQGQATLLEGRFTVGQQADDERVRRFVASWRTGDTGVLSVRAHDRLDSGADDRALIAMGEHEHVVDTPPTRELRAVRALLEALVDNKLVALNSDSGEEANP
ncbi:MAG: hypothetical protein H0U74_11045 [Bradymonadaceae bacterium]|nr:hypothetical protein [Lujinxingiaceae bacterium]